jgi:hypothetical protein
MDIASDSLPRCGTEEIGRLLSRTMLIPARKRVALELLKAERLRDLVRELDLTADNYRDRGSLISVLADGRRVDFTRVLERLSRDELKDLCGALGLPTTGREKDGLISRLMADDTSALDYHQVSDGGSAEAEAGIREIAVHGHALGSSGKRLALATLKADRLRDLVRAFNIGLEDYRDRESLIGGLADGRRIDFQHVLAELTREELKVMCAILELDFGGREKDTLIRRILSGDSASGPDSAEIADSSADDESAEGEPPIAILERLLGNVLKVEGERNCWPTPARLFQGQREFKINIYARIIGGSSRGNAMERRFQNPSQQSPIKEDPERHALLLGVWVEQGNERAVIVAFDAYRRLNRATRFSMFMPMALLEEAADTGFATHVNNKGETLYAFRPENVGRYLTFSLEEGRWPHELQEKEAGPPAVGSPLLESLAPAKIGTVYIRPRVGMYAAFARLNYKPWFALAEFIDNSIQSFIRHRDALVAAGHDGPLIIDVGLDDSELSVTDRAGGIAWADFPRAFSPAAPPEDASGLSEFGLGMKAAACWFARRWTVRTSALGDAIERTIAFDIPQISREELEDLPTETRPARESDHFTVVTMRDLRVHPRGRTLAKIKEHISSIYRILIKDGLVRIRLTTGGRTEELEYQEPPLLEAPYFRTPTGPTLQWRKEFLVDLHDRSVSGWAGIMRTGSHVHAGFSVFRRRRLVEGSIGETYKPGLIFGAPNSFASLRVRGEIFVEGFDVTHTKDGIQWHGYEDEVLESIRRQINEPGLPILEQADGYRVRKIAASLEQDFGTDALTSTAAALSMPGAAEVLRHGTAGDVVQESQSAPLASTSVLQHREFRIQVTRDAKPWTIHLELVNAPGSPFYETSIVVQEGADVVSVRINLEHEFSIAYINNNEAVLQPMLRLVAALALGEKIARDSGLKNPGVVRLNANEILRVIASDPQAT